MPYNHTIYFSSDIQNKISGLKLGLLVGNNLSVHKQSDLVTEHYKHLEDLIKAKFADRPPSSDPVVSAVRRMYRRIGWEPTQYRPSSEAMIRRFLKDKGLYRINNLVDLGNVISTRFHLPMGLYDSDQIADAITIDVGKEGETYQGISKDLIHATGKLILRDKEGVFGNPTADSERTSIRQETKNILVIFFTPPEVKNNRLSETLSELQNLYFQECPAAEFDYKVVTS